MCNFISLSWNLHVSRFLWLCWILVRTCRRFNVNFWAFCMRKCKLLHMHVLWCRVGSYATSCMASEGEPQFCWVMSSPPTGLSTLLTGSLIILLLLKAPHRWNLSDTSCENNNFLKVKVNRKLKLSFVLYWILSDFQMHYGSVNYLHVVLFMLFCADNVTENHTTSIGRRQQIWQAGTYASSN